MIDILSAEPGNVSMYITFALMPLGGARESILVIWDDVAQVTIYLFCYIRLHYVKLSNIRSYCIRLHNTMLQYTHPIPLMLNTPK